MTIRIVNSRILHRVHMGTAAPRFVASRRVCDLEHIPRGTSQIRFDTLVETEVEMIDGRRESVLSAPVDDSQIYHVRWSEKGANEILNNSHLSVVNALVEVHRHMQGVAWVICSSKHQADEQRLAAA